jgi:hypothetical protein
MGQCVSSPVIGGETEQAYRAKWEGGGLGDGLPAYQDNKFMASPSQASKQQIYSTTVGFYTYPKHNCNADLVSIA